MDTFAAAAESATGATTNRSTPTLPALAKDQTPMAWFDQVDAAAHKMKPFKHRKFVETVTGE